MSMLGKEGEIEFVLSRQHTRVKALKAIEELSYFMTKRCQPNPSNTGERTKIVVNFESDLQSMSSIATLRRQMYQQKVPSCSWNVGRIRKMEPTARCISEMLCLSEGSSSAAISMSAQAKF